MKFKNIFFGFLKTLLLAVIFYSGLLYATGGHMFLDLRNYPYTNNDFRPYFFARDESTGDLIKIPDTQNSFTFKTYDLDLPADMKLYRREVRPILRRWKNEDAPPDTDADLSIDLSGQMETNIALDSKSSREVHVAIYDDNIEAVSYVYDAKQTPEIDTIIANPEGLLEGQTTIVKGGGSALLENIVRSYQEDGIERIQLYAIESKYYAKRGWKMEPEEAACGGPS
ncbi:hypothetical protein THERMOT_1282 [Bathymodiolus thermophilus thioautotrophic gill symbiont]|uniref:hypothetical protein n=1 Tax=Bathymodiolus thermophilus thioautotrophic gill symbiont TaxID=2360 RepID=UPI00192AECD7|nr:hypothetical protein [Bathymodiolus thermophilus thioautotrophic gill symbiont]CAB5500654.1 hypothetical protein THERMOT_1282 [Bathymodiolus thermophilus thioautotrophic gill symbiont]